MGRCVLCHPSTDNVVLLQYKTFKIVPLIFSHQEKLAKSIHFLISKEDRVRTQISELDLLINQTEVSQLTEAAVMPSF